eukprot:UN25690
MNFGGYCYFLIGPVQNRNDGLAKCQEYTEWAYLPTIGSIHKLDFLVGECGGNNCWVGGDDEGWKIWDERYHPSTTIPYDDSLVAQFWEDPSLYENQENIPDGYYTMLNSDSWEIAFRDGSEEYSVLCEVDLDAKEEISEPSSYIPFQVFIAGCVLFSVCLFVSWWRLRTLQIEEQREP